jgi:hypothetical protein
MTDTPAKGAGRTSFAFERRGELPNHLGDFYRDADKARAAFETARTAQIVAPEPSQRADRSAGEDRAMRPRTARFQLPDPHPSFAQPNRKRFEEDWFQRLDCNSDGKPLTKQAFMEMREAGGKKKSKIKSR